MKHGIITLRVAKTGQVVTPSILPPLAESIAATRTGDLAFIATTAGRPMVKEGFGSWFRDVRNAAGVKGSAHGLRKLDTTRAADNGATEASFGWRGGGMAAFHTRVANRKTLAIDDMREIARRSRTGNSISASCQKVRAAELKSE